MQQCLQHQRLSHFRINDRGDRIVLLSELHLL
jgi:hypothetical protein